MKNRTFILAILIIITALSGWYIYVSSQARQMRSVQEVSVDWWGSAHADTSAEAFTHWNDDNPPVVPVSCAKCHTTNGFLDYVGQDGSTASVVDEPAAVGSVVSCQVCHNEKSDTLQTVTFPSGTQVNMGTGNALCATCHSGLSSGASVTKAVEGHGDDEVIPNASAINPHYAIAAATQLGADADSGYQYTGKSYAGRFMHANGVQTCTECHNPHSLHINQQYGKDANLCSACHSNVTSFADYRDITVDKIDYDGDGKVEGIYFEIQGMREVLYRAMQQYTAEKTGKTILWGGQYPYWFIDTNNNGQVDDGEAVADNQFTGFTPRLMRAAFNYQFSANDPAGYVHNGKYMLQLLYDSIEDLSQVTNVDMNGLVRPQ